MGFRFGLDQSQLVNKVRKQGVLTSKLALRAIGLRTGPVLERPEIEVAGEAGKRAESGAGAESEEKIIPTSSESGFSEELLTSFESVSMASTLGKRRREGLEFIGGVLGGIEFIPLSSAEDVEEVVFPLLFCVPR